MGLAAAPHYLRKVSPRLAGPVAPPEPAARLEPRVPASGSLTSSDADHRTARSLALGARCGRASAAAKLAYRRQGRRGGTPDFAGEPVAPGEGDGGTVRASRVLSPRHAPSHPRPIMTTAADRSQDAAAPWIAVREVMAPGGRERAGGRPAGGGGRRDAADPHRPAVGRRPGRGGRGRAHGRGADAGGESAACPPPRPRPSLAVPVTPLHAAADAASALPRLGERGEPRVPVVDRGRLIGETRPGGRAGSGAFGPPGGGDRGRRGAGEADREGPAVPVEGAAAGRGPGPVSRSPARGHTRPACPAPGVAASR